MAQRDQPPGMRQPSETREWTEAAWGGAGHDALLFARLPTDFAPVRLGEAEFKDALVRMVLDMPLRVVSSAPERRGGQWMPGTGGSDGEAWQAELTRSYIRHCEQRGTPGDCFIRLEDGPLLQEDDKRSIAMALAVGPALEGVDAEVRAMLDPTRVLATLSISITAYMALLAAPDPVMTKGVAAGAALLLWGYLGFEFFDLIRAYRRLSEEAARATTFEELREAGERFGQVIGPNSVRILVLVGTAAVGETAALMSRAPKLPSFGQASRTVELNTGWNLMEAAVGAERVIVSVPEGTLRAVLPMTAVAMAARGGGDKSSGGGSGTPKEGRVLPSGHRAFKSFDDFKDFVGPAGEGKQWHHIVEKREANLKRFGSEALHNTENVVPLEEGLHADVSAFYSSKQEFITGSPGLTVRQWLNTQSYEVQRQFGLRAIENIRSGAWRGRK
ncbi:hypothetical protein [Archangium violaceum]|uniref:SitA5 family polymorphic toxin n=1 Tax=Archangium violaceum TaxID=83451 RepID=UPI00126A733B|nr:hypothetical protein [Archangium violaceum]